MRRTLLFARREAAIPVADVAALHGPWRRTTVVRLGLAALLVTALAATLLAARALEPSKAAFLPRGTSGVIVLDVSLSVTDPTFRRIHNAIQDVAYELLPPGSPPEELKPLLRYFKALPERDPTDPLDVRYPANPWAAGFSAGTKISGGLRLGKEILEREGIENGSILLVSDLDTAPSDESSLTQVLADVESDGIDLHVVPLFPQAADRAFFVEALGEEALITPPQLAARNRARAEASLLGANPSLLALLGGAVLLLLAVNEWWGARVELPRRRPA